MTEWQVYLWLKADGIRSFLTILGAVIAVGSFGFAFAPMNEKPKRLWWSILALPLFLGALLLPSTKEIALINVLPKVANSDFAKQVPSDMTDMYQMAKTYMKEKLEVKKDS